MATAGAPGKTSSAPVLVPTILLGVVLVLVLIRHGQPLALDLSLQRWLSSAAGAPLTVARFVTQLGTGPVLYPALAVLAVCRLRVAGDRPRWWAFLPLLVLAAGQVLEGVLFVTLPRVAPSPSGPGTFSSGHAAAATLGWGLVAASVGSRGGGMLRISWARLLVAVLAGLVVGQSRVALGVHWATDVAAAVAFGLLLLVLGVTIDNAVGREDHATRDDAELGRRPSYSPWWWLLPAAVAGALVASLLLTPPAQRMKDLLVYQGTGFLAGSGLDVYGFRTELNMPFTYPPFAALLSEPLSRIPVGLGQVLWMIATLAATVRLCQVALAPVVARLNLPVTVAAVLLSSPLRSHLRFGQVGVFLVLAVAADLLRTHAASRWRGAGLGVAIAIKLTPAVFVPWLAAARLWGRLRATTAWLLAVTVIGIALLWRSAVDYLGHASRDTTRFGVNDIPGNQSIRGMLLRSGLSDGAAELIWLLTAVVLVVVATHGAVRLERSGQRLPAVGVLAALSVAVSPISWVHHLVWLALPLSALAAAGHWRLVAAWYVVLLPGLPALGAAAARGDRDHAALWAVVVDAQGLTAVAATLLLPRLCRPAQDREATAAADAPPTVTPPAATR